MEVVGLFNELKKLDSEKNEINNQLRNLKIQMEGLPSIDYTSDVIILRDVLESYKKVNDRKKELKNIETKKSEINTKIGEIMNNSIGSLIGFLINKKENEEPKQNL